jgi:hypothetical protein
MHFINEREDRILWNQLVPEVISDGEMASLVDSAPEESGGLFEQVILPNAHKFDQQRWIYWQVRRLKLSRINGLMVTPEFIRQEGFTQKQCANFLHWQTYPISRDITGNDLLIAVGRKEYLAAAESALGTSPVYLASAPNELAAIIRVYKQFTL